MNDERAMLKMNQQIFTAPAGSGNGATLQKLRQSGWKWPAQAAATHNNAGDDAAFKVRRDAAAGDFYFGELGHE